MRRRTLLGLIALTALSVTACSDDDNGDPPQDGGPADTGVEADAGGDASPEDGGSVDCEPQTFAVSAEATDLTDYTFEGLGADPSLTLCRGVTYTFEIDAAAIHPFWIKTEPSTGTVNAYDDGVTNNGTSNGTITFEVPESAPDELHYNCENHSAMTGTIAIVD
ncbi:MAG: hypothetical protein ACOC97_05235 [Myxococcota bacterium]